MQKIIIVLFIFFLSQIGYAAEKQMTVTGEVDAGAMMSNIVTSEGKSYAFVSDSKVGNKIFKACKVNDLCMVTGMVKNDEIIRSVISVKKMSKAYLTIPATEKRDDKNIKERKKVELKGVVQLRHNPAGRYYGLVSGKKDYTLVYVWAINDNDLNDKLETLADGRAKVAVKGTLRIWNDGSASFDNAAPIEIYK